MFYNLLFTAHFWYRLDSFFSPEYLMDSIEIQTRHEWEIWEQDLCAFYAGANFVGLFHICVAIVCVLFETSVESMVHVRTHF